MDDKPNGRIFSLTSRLFLIGVLTGYSLAAFGEHALYSTGILMGTAFGALVGGFIGSAEWIRKPR
jgi:hypothetical protein